jgi:hypothetical protein
MGVRTELFVSTRGNARRFEKRRERALPPAYVRVESGSVMPVELGRLWAILLNEPYDAARHELENLYFGTHLRTRFGRVRRKLLMWKAVVRALLGGEIGSSGLYRFPPAYVRTLAALDDRSLQAAAATWARAEGMADRGPADAQGLLLELRRLAAHAESTRRQLFIWGTTSAERDAEGDRTAPVAAPPVPARADSTARSDSDR